MRKPPVNKKSLEDYLKQSSSQEEAQKIENWYNSFDDEKVEVTENVTEQEIEQRLRERLTASVRKTKIVKLKWIGKVAASVSFGLTLTYGAYQYFSKKNMEEFLEPREIAFSGRQTGALVKINEKSAAILDKRDQETFKYDKDGFLKVNNIAVQNLASDEVIEIVVPKGKQFKVRLTDGSKVWLNADSRLSFPKNFAEDQRLVFLTGQGYFEVEKNPHKPFVVQTIKQKIKVLGTHFEVNSYGDNGFEETALLEGKVEVSNLDGTISKVLTPGQSAKVDLVNGSISKASFVSRNAWIDNIFSFENQSLHEILSNVSRWYNVAVVYKNSVTTKTFSGKIKKDASLYDVVEMLQLVSGADIKLIKNQIVVTN